MNGYIKLHKTIKAWEWYDQPNVFNVFLHLLIEANYEDKVWKGITIKRGSLITSYDSLSKMTGLSIQNVRTAISNLKSTRELTIKSYRKYTEISINNYENYQGVTRTLTSNQLSTNKQLTTTKEIKKERNIYTKTQISGLEKSLVDNLPEAEITPISARLKVKPDLVRSYKDQYVLWVKGKPEDKSRHGRDMKATVESWLRRDISSGKVKIKQSFVEKAMAELERDDDVTANII